jgi:flagellar biosynthetic protein FliR
VDQILLRLPWEQLLGVFALFLRAMAFVAVAPIVGADVVPARLRVGLAVLLALVLAPLVPPPAPSVSLVGVALSESVCGLFLGFAVRIVTDGALVAGSLAGMSTGLSIANLLDPVSMVSSPVLGIFYRVVGSLVFCAIGGHRVMLEALAATYELVPIGGLSLSGPWIEGATVITGRVLSWGIRIAAPVLIAGLLADIALMLVARAVPAMNVLVVGAPIRLVCGLLAAGVSLHLMVPVLQAATDNTVADALRMLRTLAGGG